MNRWHVNALELEPHAPQVLSSTSDARAIALAIPAGERLPDHQVHERAWVVVLDGEVEITTTAGDTVTGHTGLVVEFAPGERHAVRAASDARLLLLLTPWPGVGQPATMTPRTRTTRTSVPQSVAPDLRPRGTKGHEPLHRGQQYRSDMT